MSDPSVFTPPSPSGDQSARRLVRDVIRSCDVYERDYKLALDDGSSLANRTANASRFTLEDDIAALRNLSKVSETLWPKVNDAMERGATVLGNLDLIVDPNIDVDNVTNTYPTPFPQDVTPPIPGTSNDLAEFTLQEGVATRGVVSPRSGLDVGGVGVSPYASPIQDPPPVPTPPVDVPISIGGSSSIIRPAQSLPLTSTSAVDVPISLCGPSSVSNPSPTPTNAVDVLIPSDKSSQIPPNPSDVIDVPNFQVRPSSPVHTPPSPVDTLVSQYESLPNHPTDRQTIVVSHVSGVTNEHIIIPGDVGINDLVGNLPPLDCSSSATPTTPSCASIGTPVSELTFRRAPSALTRPGVSTTCPNLPNPLVSPNPIPTSPLGSSSPPVPFHPASVSISAPLTQRNSDSRSTTSSRDEVAAAQEQRRQHRLEMDVLERDRDHLLLQIQLKRLEREKEVLRRQAEEKEFERQLEAKTIKIRDSRDLEKARIEEEEADRLAGETGNESVNVEEWLNGSVIATRPSTVSFSLANVVNDNPNVTSNCSARPSGSGPTGARGASAGCPISPQNPSGSDLTGVREASAGCPIFPQSPSGSDPAGVRGASAGCPNFPQPSTLASSANQYSNSIPHTIGSVNRHTTCHPVTCHPSDLSSDRTNRPVHSSPSTSVTVTLTNPVSTIYSPIFSSLPFSYPYTMPTSHHPASRFGPMSVDFEPCPSRPIIPSFAPPPVNVSMSTSVQPPISLSQFLDNPSTPRPAPSGSSPRTSTPPVATTSPNSNVDPGVVMERMLNVNLKNEARNLLTAARPSTDKLFSGDSSEVDYETFIARFDRMTNIEGVDDRMRLVELPHYVSGTAAIIVSSYEDISDASQALTQIKTHLKRDFGRRVYSARQLLEQVLKGGALTTDKPGEIRTFLIKLEQAHRRGIETQRENLFSNPELIHEIIRRKLPFVSEKWASKLYDRDEKITIDDNLSELGFADFLSFVRRLNGCKMHDRAIMTKPSVIPQDNNSHSSNPHRTPFRFPKLAPVTAAPVPTDDSVAADGSVTDQLDISLAASTSSAPKIKKNSQKPLSPRASGNTVAPQGQSPCPLCSGQHGVYRCREFIRADVSTRIRIVREHKLCRRCLNPGHFGDQCPLNFSCRGCEGPHNSLIHVDPSTPGNGSPMSQF